MATGQAYRKRDVDKVGALSIAHQAKAALYQKLFEDQSEFRYDGPGTTNFFFNLQVIGI